MRTPPQSIAPPPAWVRRVPTYAGGLVCLIGVVMLIGWTRHFSILAADIPALPTMKANTALSATFAGLSLIDRIPLGRWLTLVPMAIGGMTLLEWTSGRSLGIDQLLVHDSFAAQNPGRSSLQAAMSMVLFAIARWLSGGRPSLARIGGVATAAYACLVLVLELGWMFQAPELASLNGGPGLSGPSAACLASLAVGLAGLHAERRPLVYLWDKGPAGTVVRRLLPWVIVAPPTLGLVPVATHNLNLGTATFAGSMVVLLAVVVTVTAQSIHRVEIDRARAERALRAAEQRARQLSERDPLTGIWNRRWFEAELRSALGHMVADPAGGALLIIDVDHFKLVNDTAGHQAGDRLLVAVAQSLVEAVPEPASVSRIGGDEFAIVLPRGDRTAVERVALDVVAAVRDSAGRAGTTLVTASVGVALFADLSADGRTEQVLLVRADEALYAAKRAGRDRHRCYRPSLVRGA
ncbi:MAG TPA: GGDEF domain-containing protein [Nocardioides sp.]|nr:GGDEF domain-containing protein [Nocardioides sp.]